MKQDKRLNRLDSGALLLTLYVRHLVSSSHIVSIASIAAHFFLLLRAVAPCLQVASSQSPR